MMEFGSFSGTIMIDNTELVHFEMHKGNVKECTILAEKLVPYEYRICDDVKRATWFFLEDRVVPSTRIGIDEDLKKVGLPYYDPTMLLKFNHGYCVSDHYWIRFDGENLTYEELKKWAMSTMQTSES